MSTSLTPPPLGQRIEKLFAQPSSGVAALLVAATVVMAFVSPSFISFGNWANIANQMVFVLLLALGMTVVLIVRGIDLSVGSVMGLSAGVAAYLITQGLILPLALLAGIACGVVCGFLNALMITKLGLPDFVATLAMMGVARGVLFLWTKGTPFTNYMTPDYNFVGGLAKIMGFLSFPILVALLMWVLVSVLLRRTILGRHFYAVGGSPEAAKLSGVPVARVQAYAYMLSGGIAGLAGVILAGRTTNVAPTMGTGYEILAIAAAIIGGAALAGGRGRAFGAVLGALTLTLTTNAMNIAGISSDWQQVATGLILTLAILLDRLTAHFKERQTKAALQGAPVSAAKAPVVQPT